jgi:NADPH-dependent 2,4-dienoyl-CoA reductase/sulfur reductase-like enzyme
VSPVSESFGLLVIGSGPAGVSAVAAYVDAGGPGPVCLVSADPEPPYQRPPLSKTVLTGEEPAEGRPILQDAAALDRVEVRLATSVAELDLEDRVVRTTDGAELGYERLVVATGARPVTLDGVAPGAEVHPLRSLEHARALAGAVAGARTAVVVGSGFIGCEAAASLAVRGLETTLVTPEDAPQATRLGPWAAARLGGWLAEAGVTLVTGTQVTGIGSPRTVLLEDGTELRPDVVLAAVGVSCEQAFLTTSGLHLGEGGVVVDHELRSRDPRVWGAGDVARAHHAVAGRRLSVEHWGDALTMGGLAGANAAAAARGDAAGSWATPPGFWSEVGSHTLKYSAWGDGFASAVPVEGPGGAFTVWYADAAGELVGVLTHERDADYERGGELLARRASLDEALSGRGSHR